MKITLYTASWRENIIVECYDFIGHNHTTQKHDGHVPDLKKKRKEDK